jgi:hypothetical protein
VLSHAAVAAAYPITDRWCSRTGARVRRGAVDSEQPVLSAPQHSHPLSGVLRTRAARAVTLMPLTHRRVSCPMAPPSQPQIWVLPSAPMR